MWIERHCELLQLCSVYMWNSFWDWEKGERLDYFYNGNPRYTRITAMEYLNGHDCSLLLTATGQFTYHSGWSTLWSVLMSVSFYADLHHATFCADDGALRIWKNFADQRNPEMVTAWQGLSDMLPTTRGLLSHSLCKYRSSSIIWVSFPSSTLCSASVWKKLSEFPVFLHDAGL